MNGTQNSLILGRVPACLTTHWHTAIHSHLANKGVCFSYSRASHAATDNPPGRGVQSRLAMQRHLGAGLAAVQVIRPGWHRLPANLRCARAACDRAVREVAVVEDCQAAALIG